MGKQTFKHVIELFETLVSIVALMLVTIIIIFMISSLGVSTFNFFSNFGSVLEMMGNINFSQELVSQRRMVEIQLLHSIAFTIVLIKAIKILLSYTKTHHLNIKFLVEISIIAPTIEILFNSHSYTPSILTLFGVFGIANLIIYVTKFDTFKHIGSKT